MKNKKLITGIIITAVLAINISFGLPRLARYSSVDEPYWTYDRTPDFWRAIAKHKWKNTDINDKPGITVAIISGLGLNWVDPMQFKSLRQEEKTPETAQEIINLNFALRLPIYLTTLLFLLLFFWFLDKLLGRTIALLSLIFIGLSPILLGISLIINPDSLLWGFLPLSFLAYFVHRKKTIEEDAKEVTASDKDIPGKIIHEIIAKRKYLILAGFLLGLALLTKYVANIGYVFFLGLIFLEYIFSEKIMRDFPSYIKKSLADYIFLIVVSCLTFFLLYPACWHDPRVLLEGTLLSPAFSASWPIFAGFFALLFSDIFFLKSKVAEIIVTFFARYKKYLKKTIGFLMLLGLAYIFLNVFSGMKFFDFAGEMASPKGGSDYSFFDFIQLSATDLYGLIFGLTPLVLLSFIWAVFAGAFKKENSSTFESNLVLYFSIFILLYYVASTANHVTATIRYQIALFPLAAIMAAIGAKQFISGIKIKKSLFYAAAVLVSLGSLFLISPHFFSYASILLPKKYILNLKGMGDGSFEVAQYLNGLPDSSDLIIWSDKGAVCETFLGECKVGFSKKDTQNIDFDYFVASTDRKSRSLKLESAGYFDKNIEFERLYSTEGGIYKITIGGRPNNFVKVVPTEELKNK